MPPHWQLRKTLGGFPFRRLRFRQPLRTQQSVPVRFRFPQALPCRNPYINPPSLGHCPLANRLLSRKPSPWPPPLSKKHPLPSLLSPHPLRPAFAMPPSRKPFSRQRCLLKALPCRIPFPNPRPFPFPYRRLSRKLSLKPFPLSKKHPLPPSPSPHPLRRVFPTPFPKLFSRQFRPLETRPFRNQFRLGTSLRRIFPSSPESYLRQLHPPPSFPKGFQFSILPPSQSLLRPLRRSASKPLSGKFRPTKAPPSPGLTPHFSRHPSFPRRLRHPIRPLSPKPPPCPTKMTSASPLLIVPPPLHPLRPPVR